MNSKRFQKTATGFICSSLLALGLASTLPAQAGSNQESGKPPHHEKRECKHHGKRDHHGPMVNFKRLTKKLDLNDEQQVSVKKTLDETMPKLASHRKSMHEARKSLHEMIVSGNYTDKAAQQIINEQSQAMSDMLRLSAKLRNDIFAVLNEEQQQKAEAYLAKRRA